jgi:integrase
MSEMRLLDTEGRRLYLNAEERAGFLKAARSQDPVHCAFAELLYFTGCRISEALEVTPERIDQSDNYVILRSLKKRREDVYRAVPGLCRKVGQPNVLIYTRLSRIPVIG